MGIAASSTGNCLHLSDGVIEGFIGYYDLVTEWLCPEYRGEMDAWMQRTATRPTTTTTLPASYTDRSADPDAFQNLLSAWEGRNSMLAELSPDDRLSIGQDGFCLLMDEGNSVDHTMTRLMGSVVGANPDATNEQLDTTFDALGLISDAAARTLCHEHYNVWVDWYFGEAANDYWWVFDEQKFSARFRGSGG